MMGNLKNVLCAWKNSNQKASFKICVADFIHYCASWFLRFLANTFKICSSVVMLHFDKGGGEEYYKLGGRNEVICASPSHPHYVTDKSYSLFGIWFQSLSNKFFCHCHKPSVTEPYRHSCTQVSELRVSELTVLFDILVSSLSKPG